MNENYEVMEQEVEMDAIEVIDGCENGECERRGGAGLAALVVGGLLAGTAIAVAAVKKHKKNKAEQPAKPKTKLKLVRVPVEEPMEEVTEVPAEENVDENTEA